jgi:hypothetical protein
VKFHSTKSLAKFNLDQTAGVSSVSQCEPVRTRSVVKARQTKTTAGILRICIFFLLLGITAFGLNQLLNQGIRQVKTSDIGTFNKMMAGKVNAEIIINGSSRAVAHYDPRIIQSVTGRSAYNLGRNASQIDLELAILKTYLKHNAKPKVVIQNLDLFSFQLTSKGDIYEPALYLPYLNEETLYETLRTINPEVWKWKHIPLYGYSKEDIKLLWITGVRTYVGLQPPEDFFSGFNPRYTSWNEDFERFRVANPDGVAFKVDPAGVKALEELITTCRRGGIRVVLVYSPRNASFGNQSKTNHRTVSGNCVKI